MSARPVHKRLRVLLIAEACNPAWTSVPLLAYHWYQALRKRVDLTLVTQIRNKAAFERCDSFNDDLVFIDSEPVARPCWRAGRLLTLGRAGGLTVKGAAAWLGYLYFEHLVWKRFRTQLLRGDFDLVHRLTPLSPTFPSPIAGHSPVPFVLGPLNGSLPWPCGTTAIRACEAEWLAPVRPVYRALPYWRQTFERAALVIAAAKHVRRDLPRRAQRRCTILAENGADTKLFSPDSAAGALQRRVFTILFVGRLIPLKQPALLLEAVARAQLEKRSVRVVYAGEGPERARIQATAERLGLSKQVELVGPVSHEQLPAYYRAASLLALPSVHESGGAVVLEAMACGLPCVVVDYGGPSEYVSDEAGIRVPLGTHDEMIAGFAEAFRSLFGDRRRLSSLSHSAVRLARRKYSWDAKAEQMLRLYESVLRASRTPGKCTREQRPAVFTG